MKMPFNLITIDIETTGSNSSLSSIIQLSAIMLDKEFNIVQNKEFNLYVQPLDSYRDVNAMLINKIPEEILRTAYNLNDTLELFENFCGKNKILSSWGNYFDINFLRKQYDKIGRQWPFSYKSIDLKSIAIFEMSKKEIQVKGGLQNFLNILNIKFIGKPHNALDDIKNSVYILQHFLKKVE